MFDQSEVCLRGFEGINKRGGLGMLVTWQRGLSVSGNFLSCELKDKEGCNNKLIIQLG